MEGDGSFSGEAPPRNTQNAAAHKKLQATQAKVDEVVDIMRTNVEKVLERDQKLSELDNRADALQQGATIFEQQAGKLKKKYWWKNVKMMIIMGVIAAILLIIIIVWATSGSGGSNNNNSGNKMLPEPLPSPVPNATPK